MNHSGQFLPFALLRGQQQLHQVGAHAEVVAVAADDESGKVAHRIGAGIEHRGDQCQHIAADGILERVQLDAADAVAEIDQRGSGVGPDHSVGAAEIGDPRVPGNGGNGFQLACFRLEALAAILGIPARLAGRQQSIKPRAYRQAERLHPGDGRGHPGSIHHFKWPQLPVEAGAHGAVD